MLLFLAASPFTVCHLYRLSRRRANAPAEIGGFFRRPGRVCVPSALRGCKAARPVPGFPPFGRPLAPLGWTLQPVLSPLQPVVFRLSSIAQNVQRPCAKGIRASATCARACASCARSRAPCAFTRKKPVNTGILPAHVWILPRENESCRQHAPPAGRRTVTTAPRGTGRRRAIARDGTERNLAQSRKGAKPQTRPAIPKSPSFARPCCAGAPRLCVRYIPFLHPSSFISHL